MAINLRHELAQFLWACISRWGSYATGGVVTGLIHVYERLSSRTLPRRTYFLIFVVTFSIAACFMAWREQYERAQNAEKALSQKPTQPIQVNVPPAQVIITPPSDANRLSVTKRWPKESASPKVVDIINQIARLADRGTAIQTAWMKANDTAAFIAEYEKWTKDADTLLNSVGTSYAVQFRNARGSAMMGCPADHSIKGCGYWQDINGKNATLISFITELRQRQ